MILPTSITPWYIWTALGVFGMGYAPYMMLYKRNNKLSNFVNLSMSLLMFSLSSFMVLNSLLDQYRESNNIIVTLYNTYKNNMDGVVTLTLLIQTIITVYRLFYELYVAETNKKEKNRLLFKIIIFYSGLLVAIIMMLSLD